MQNCCLRWKYFMEALPRNPSNKYASIIIIILIFFCLSVTFQNFGGTSLKEPMKNVELDVQLKGPLQHDDEGLLKYLKENVLLPPSSLPYNLSTDPLYRYQKHSHTWSFINSVLKSLFNGLRNGFFVEAGALDGEYLSNSLWLEQHLDWTGLLIEPENIGYRDLVWKRRKAWSSHSCLSDDKFPKQVIMLSSRKLIHSIANTVEVRGTTFQLNYIDSSPILGNVDLNYFTTQCYPLFSSLLALNISVVDFLSLDLQGAELAVFDTIPLDKVYIRSFVLEHINLKAKYDLISRFNKLGFDLLISVEFGPDYFFINRNDTILMKKSKKLGMAQRFIDKIVNID